MYPVGAIHLFEHWDAWRRFCQGGHPFSPCSCMTTQGSSYLFPVLHLPPPGAIQSVVSPRLPWHFTGWWETRVVKSCCFSENIFKPPLTEVLWSICGLRDVYCRAVIKSISLPGIGLYDPYRFLSTWDIPWVYYSDFFPLCVHIFVSGKAQEQPKFKECRHCTLSLGSALGCPMYQLQKFWTWSAEDRIPIKLLGRKHKANLSVCHLDEQDVLLYCFMMVKYLFQAL